MKNCTGRNCPMQFSKIAPETCEAKGCPWRTEIITNADRIRAMTDDMQLAIFFASVSGCPYDREIALDKCELWSNACVSCWLNWLKQEARG